MTRGHSMVVLRPPEDAFAVLTAVTLTGCWYPVRFTGEIGLNPTVQGDHRGA
jgi:hypothetical protein